MRFLIALSLFVTAIAGTAQVEQLRTLYLAAGTNTGIEAFYQYTKNLQPTNAVEIAYKGVAEAMYAEVASGVKDKFNYFNRGKALLEQAINQDVYHPEIRFLRFSVQAEVPMIVGYRDNLAEDTWKIIGALKARMMNERDDFWRKAIRFMLESGELDAGQKRELQVFAS
jgi:hypothetical protein